MRRRGRLILNPTLQLTALVDVAQRGKGRRRIEYTDARVLRLLGAAVTGGRRPRLDAALARRLRRDGILVRPADVPHDVHLDARLGARGLTDVAVAHPARVVSPRLRAGTRLCRGPRLPADVARRTPSTEPFLPAEDILWVRQAGSGIAIPYTLTPDVARVARALQRRSRHALRDPRGVVLHAVGAVGGTGEVARERADWRRRVRDWRRELHDSGYAVLRDLFSPVFVEAVREYYRRLEREGYLLGREVRRRGRPLVHDEPVLTFLGGQLATVVRQVTRRREPSTFSFLRIYEGGAILEPHRDHPVCRWNIDLVVGGEPPPVRRTAWPLWVATRPGRRAVRLGLGDGVLYRGTDVTHWRSAQPARHSTVIACFHYGRAPS